MLNLKEFNPEKICSLCKGSCCKSMAGAYVPSDFEEVSYESLKSLIDSGKVSIDWWESFNPDYFISKNKDANPIIPKYYLRARHVNADIVDPSMGGICINLREDGCALTRNNMPIECKTLKPGDENTPCTNEINKEKIVELWQEYSSILDCLAKEYSPELYKLARFNFYHKRNV